MKLNEANWIPSSWRVLLSQLVLLSTVASLSYGATCGYPGRPAYGRLLKTSNQTEYNDGDTVYFQCNSGYYMKGRSSRLCLPNGLWSGDLPICDTTLDLEGLDASSRESMKAYPPELAIDGNPRTCYYSSRHSPKWWRLDMMTNQRVLSVAVTVPFASSEHFFTVYVVASNGSPGNASRCSSFSGIFVTQTNVLVCGAGSGIEGRYLHIEDESRGWDFFGLCEVKAFVEKDRYDCGLPERPLHSELIEPRPSSRVQFTCLEGYTLEGTAARDCLQSGHWSGTQPICREVTCQDPPTIQRGSVQVTGSVEGRAVQFSLAHYSCDAGFTLEGNSSRSCGPNGQWSGGGPPLPPLPPLPPRCLPVDCGAPPNETQSLGGGKLILLNGSTTYQSLSELRCFYGQAPAGGNTIIHCRSDASWSQLEATCEFEVNPDGMQRRVAGLSPRNIDSRVGTILCSVIFGVLFCILALVGFLFKKKILLIKFGPKNRKDRKERREGSSSSSEQYKASKLVLSEFRCSLPMSRSGSKASSARPPPSSWRLEDKEIYQEISAKGTSGTTAAATAGKVDTGRQSPMGSGLSFARDCLAAACREKTKTEPASPENDDKSNDDSVAAEQPRLEFEKEAMDGSAVLALYAKVDFVQKRKRQRLFGMPGDVVVEEVATPPPQPSTSPPTMSNSPPLEPYVVIDNNIFSGHPAARRPSARF